MNFPVEYEDKSTCEYVVKTIGVTKKMMHRYMFQMAPIIWVTFHASIQSLYYI